jgi:hypothetical protein
MKFNALLVALVTVVVVIAALARIPEHNFPADVTLTATTEKVAPPASVAKIAESGKHSDGNEGKKKNLWGRSGCGCWGTWW